MTSFLSLDDLLSTAKLDTGVIFSSNENSSRFAIENQLNNMLTFGTQLQKSLSGSSFPESPSSSNKGGLWYSTLEDVLAVSSGSEWIELGGYTTNDADVTSQSIGLCGMVYFERSDTGNVGSGEDDLHSFTLDAGLLEGDDWGLEILQAGTTLANKAITLRTYIGANEIMEAILPSDTANRGWWKRTIMFSRSDNVVRASASYGFGGDAEGVAVGDTPAAAVAADFSTALTIKETGENTTDTTNDAVIQQLTIVIMKISPVTV